jgi:predicted DNA-binding transcriptional regulator AlpA
MTKKSREPLPGVAEVAAYLDVPPSTLHQWRHRGTGPKASKVGRWLRYRWEDVESWLDTQAQGSGDGDAA